MAGEGAGKTSKRGDPAFGKHVRRLRRARGMTQEEFAERSGLSVDGIRRVELGRFSPSLETITKLCEGLRLSRSTLFAGFEVGERDVAREVVDATGWLSDRERELVLRIIQVLGAE